MTPQGRYTILGEIASGGTATVFLAEDIVLRRKVALKKLHPHLLNHPEMVKRFEKEAVAVASLSHENVVKIFDFGREDKSVFLAMEYVDGSSLDSILKGSDGRIPNLAALCLFHQLLAGLAAAHACGIFHRDIKPSNVLVDRKGCVRIADFGIAFLSEDTSITRTGAYLGTPGYSAPEQAVGRPVTAKTDIYATGTLFYRCLTGRLPFAGETPHAVLMAIVEKTQVKANLVNPRILPGLADLVQDMLAKSPAKRPDALECARRLEKIAVDAGFPLDPARLCRMTAGASAYAEKERKELAARFVEQARLMETQGKTREAMKRYSLAEIFTEKNDEQAREAGRHLRMGTATSLRRGAAALAAIALLAFGIRLAVKTSREAEPDAPKAGKELTAAVSAPATAAESLELPSLVPEWPEGDARTGIGNGTFSDATA
ncbi:MAG: serine/threonine protein kinase, partial [Fibrobacteres bacterium]|nr:serine/threonine protein kinase [Fibrobacterota bacterium]